MTRQETRDYDVVVVGAGPGGYPAAIRAAQFGLRTAVVEADRLGGVCLNVGCIPTKALLHGAEVLRTVRSAAQFGITVGEPQVDVGRLVEHAGRTSAQLVQGVQALLRGNGVDVIRGRARFLERGLLVVERTADSEGPQDVALRLRADHIVLATGARARTLPEARPDGKNVWTYREALRPTEFPERLVVVGSGAIGSEFAALYAELGSEVTVLEAMDRMMPGESALVSETMAAVFRERGIAVHAGVRGIRAASGEPSGGEPGATVSWTDAQGGQHQEEVSAVLVAVGVQPCTEGLGLEELGVLGPDGSVRTDGLGRTAVWGLYAVGDVAGGPCLAHKATHEGIRCIEAIAGFRREEPEEDWRAWIPRCTYTSPEVAGIGWSREAAEKAGHRVRTAAIPFAQNGRALGAGETEGQAEVVLDAEDGRVLGLSMVGAGVSELVGLVSVAHQAQLDAEGLAHAMVPHPSRAEAVHEAVLKALGRPVNAL